MAVERRRGARESGYRIETALRELTPSQFRAAPLLTPAHSSVLCLITTSNPIASTRLTKLLRWSYRRFSRKGAGLDSARWRPPVPSRAHSPPTPTPVKTLSEWTASKQEPTVSTSSSYQRSGPRANLVPAGAALALADDDPPPPALAKLLPNLRPESSTGENKLSPCCFLKSKKAPSRRGPRRGSFQSFRPRSRACPGRRPHLLAFAATQNRRNPPSASGSCLSYPTRPIAARRTDRLRRRQSARLCLLPAGSVIPLQLFPTNRTGRKKTSSRRSLPRRVAVPSVKRPARWPDLARVVRRA